MVSDGTNHKRSCSRMQSPALFMGPSFGASMRTSVLPAAAVCGGAPPGAVLTPGAKLVAAGAEHVAAMTLGTEQTKHACRHARFRDAEFLRSRPARRGLCVRDDGEEGRKTKYCDVIGYVHTNASQTAGSGEGARGVQT